MKLNQKNVAPTTHEGGAAVMINPEQQLRRTLMSCMLWEQNFYEDGQSVADRIKALVPLIAPRAVSDMAIEARTKGKLRHAPLLIAREMARHKIHLPFVEETLTAIIQRPDELNEFLAIYWQDDPYVQNKKQSPLAASVKRGLANAFKKFDEYSLAKYNRDSAIKLRDVLFMCHAKPNDAGQESLWKRLIDGTLVTPDTWEVELSASKDKLASWTRLLDEKKLGALAMLRNIRNMERAGVDRKLISKGLESVKVDRVLPFRFVAAARYAPQLEPALETAMFKCIEGQAKLPGKTILLVDISGSMNDRISGKSEMTRLDAACGLAILAKEVCEDSEVFTFSTKTVEVPNRRGFALRDAILKSQPMGGTYLTRSLQELHMSHGYDRIIVFTDEQSHDGCIPAPKTDKGYIVNVAAYKNGVGCGPWNHVDGFSENILTYIQEVEK